jgi:hypothetical protein
MSGQSCKSFDEVHHEELVDVVKRRRIAGAEPEDSPDPPHDRVKDELVGVAMSGGGIRSASFGLGVLQSLYRNGIFKHVDYLSTVSGGGYVGAFFSSLIVRANGRVHWGPQSDNPKDVHRLPFESDENGKQPDIVRRLLKHGSTLRQPIRFLSRHLWGLLLINMFALSGLFAISAVASYVFRLVYSPTASLYLPELGFGTDVSRSFFPAFLMFCLWITSSVLVATLRRAGKNPPRWPQFFYVGLIATFLMGIAGLMATDDVSLSKYEAVLGLPAHVSNQIRVIINWVTAGVLSFFGIALMPYLNLRALLNSGSQTQSVLKNWVFSVASNALVFGTPFVVFFILAHENISSHLTKRPDAMTMCRASIGNWPGFWQTVEGQRPTVQDKEETDFVPILFGHWPMVESRTTTAQAEDETHLAEFLYQVANNSDYALADEESDDDRDNTTNTHEIMILQDRINQTDRETWFLERWINFAIYKIGSESSEFGNGLSDRKKRDRLREVVVQRINTHCLSNPRLVEHFAASQQHTKPVGDESAEMKKLIATGEALVKSLQEANQEVSQKDRDRSRLIAEGQSLTKMFYKLPGINRSNEDITPGVTLDDAIDESREELEDKEEEVDNSRSEDRTKARQEVSEARQELSRVEGLVRRIRENNWNLLMSEYGGSAGYIRPPDTVFAILVNEADQSWRLKIAVISLIAFVILGWVLNLNKTSLHGFYRDQLEQVWIGGSSSLLLKDLDTVSKGGPIQIFNGTNNLLAQHGDRDVENMSTFHFTNRYCGTRRMAYRKTREYCQGDLSVADVMAISGAAVTATIRTTLLFKLILVLTNFRLGRWLPMPSKRPGGLERPSPLRLSAELPRPPENRTFCFVSDGGHHENTGIGSLMMRRCRVIIAVDGTFDPKSTFIDFVKQIRNARWKYGVQVTSIEKLDDGSWKPLDVSSLVADKETGLSESHFVVARIRYPAGDGEDGERYESLEGFMIFIKPALTNDESLELRKYQEERPEFPHDPTLDQFFEPVRFESYRELGEHACDNMVAMLKKTKTDDENWLATWNPMTSESAEPEPSSEAASEKLEAPLTTRVIDDLAKGLESADEAARERIYGHFGDEGEALGSGLRRKIAKIMLARHAQETDDLRGKVEKVLSTIGDGISQIDEFFQRMEKPQRKRARARTTPRTPKKQPKRR